MGNAESGQHSDDEESYDYHKKVLKEGSTPVKGSRTLPTTHESDDDGFEDAREDIDQSTGSESHSESFTGSVGSVSGSADSSTGSGSSGSNSGSSGSVDQSPQSGSSSDRSTSDPSTSGSSKASRSDLSTGSLLNRIRVIDTDSEDEDDELERTRKKSHPRKQLDFSDKTSDKEKQHKALPRPIPIHKETPTSSQEPQSEDMEPNRQGQREAPCEIPSETPGTSKEPVSSIGNYSTENISGRHQQVKRKADDMDPEEEEEQPMSVPVKKNGGHNRPFARRKELRDIVLGRRDMEQKTGSKMETEVEARDEDMEMEENIQREKDVIQSRFEHSNNSPFKNFTLQPSSSDAGAELSASAETPKDHSQMPNSLSGVKRSTCDPDPSISGEMGQKTSFKSQPSTSGTRQGGKVLPNRGNSKEFSIKTEDQRNQNWTSQLPKVNVAAAEKRFEGVSVARHSPVPSTSEWHKTVLRIHGDRYSFLLADALNVHICYDDITQLRTDALVNPTDGQLTHVNDTARSIAMAAGPQMTNQCQFFLRQNGGRLETTEVVETYACGTLSGRVGHVIHLAAPVFEAANEKSSVHKLMASYLNCLNHINDNLGLVSVVFPCIGAGSYPQDTCINVFFESLLAHIAERKNASIKTVKFVLSDVHLGNMAIDMIQAHLERSILEGIDILMAEALNNYYGNSKWECNQNSVNDQLGRQLEVDSPKKLFRGPPVKRPKL